MDDRWDERVKEYGAINITGFRIIDSERPIVQQFFRTWESLDPTIYPGAGKPFIPVRKETFNRYKSFSSLRFRIRDNVRRICQEAKSCNLDALDNFRLGSSGPGLWRRHSGGRHFQPYVEEEAGHVPHVHATRQGRAGQHITSPQLLSKQCLGTRRQDCQICSESTCFSHSTRF